MPCWLAPEPDQEVDQSEFRVVSTQSAQGPIQCMLMRWSIHALPNCLGMLVSRIAKHAFEILEPLLQEPIDGRTSHDDQTRFICKRTQWHCSCIPAWWLCNLLAPASSFACFACKFHEFVACMSLAKGQTRQARDWKLVSRSKVESVNSINPSNAEQNLSTLTAAPWTSRVPVAMDSVN